MKRLAILGASGHGKVIADAALLAGFDDIDFFDDAWPQLQFNSRWNVAGDTATLLDCSERYDGVIVAIGDNTIRIDKVRFLQKSNVKIISILHPTSIVSPFASIGDGTFLSAGAVVQVDAKVGAGCIINTGSVIEHDCVLGDGVHVSPSATLAGGVVVLDRAWIGASVVVKQLIAIGTDVVVGAGCVVVKNVPDYTTVIGNPARQLIR